MAKIIKNDKDFKIISLTTEDITKLGFGFDNTCVCMRCNQIIIDNIYYIAVLNDTMDEECYQSWLKSAKRYAEDIPYETRNFNRILSYLEI